MRLLASLALSLSLFGCDDDEHRPYAPGQLEAVAEWPGAPGDPAAQAELFAAERYAEDRCDTANARLDVQRRLRIFTGPGVHDVERFTRGLQRWFRRHGVDFVAEHAPLTLPIDWALDLNERRLQRALRAEFPEVDFASPTPPDATTLGAIERAAFGFMMAPVLDFVDVYGREGEGVTNVVLLPRVKRGERQARDGLRDPIVLGLALSPTLLRSFQAGAGLPGERELWSNSPLDATFTPMMFINAGLLEKLVAWGMPETLIDLTMAHELGHTLGLHHVQRDENLMKPGFETDADLRCTVRLDDDQLDVAAQTLATDQVARGALTASVERPAARRWGWVRDRLAGRPLPLH